MVTIYFSGGDESDYLPVESEAAHRAAGFYRNGYLCRVAPEDSTCFTFPAGWPGYDPRGDLIVHRLDRSDVRYLLPLKEELILDDKLHTGATFPRVMHPPGSGFGHDEVRFKVIE